MLIPCVLLTTLAAAPAAEPRPLALKDGDRIVWIGNTLVEREQRYGYWETALLAANPDKHLTVRNLGWSGDTVFGDARAAFDPPAKGFERLVSLTLELKPTVIFVSYGGNESFEGKEGLPKFEKGLEKLLDALKPAGARIVLFSPLPFQAHPRLDNPKPLNEKLALYTDAIKAVADRRGLEFHDLFHLCPVLAPELTENGQHLTGDGYKATAAYALPSGATAGAGPPNWERLEKLRQIVVEKNQLFFYRWRPQNETYLFGFRKHEQGKNAKEIVEFDPLIGKVEAAIEAILKSPVEKGK